MTEINFYHLTFSPLERALPKLLERTLEGGKRALVLAASGGYGQSEPLAMAGLCTAHRSHRLGIAKPPLPRQRAENLVFFIS